MTENPTCKKVLPAGGDWGSTRYFCDAPARWFCEHDVVEYCDEHAHEGDCCQLDTLGLGPCCRCGGSKAVRTLVMLNKPGLTPGQGWGCLACGLPANGAIAVLCDDCAAAAEECRRQGGQVEDVLTSVCAGADSLSRVPVTWLPNVSFDHDASKHPELSEARR